MMRRLVQRHHGILPLDTAESIWRVIIATFTHVQAPFSVHADLSAGDAADARQRALPFRLHGAVRARMSAPPAWSPRCPSPRAISAWCRPSPPPTAAPGGPRWSSTSAPKIIARLPFVDRPDHPAPLNVFVVSRAAADAMVDRGRDLERAGRRLERRGRPRRARARRDRSRCRTAPSTARRCWSRCRRRRSGRDQGRAGQGRRHGALGGPRRQPRDPLYGAGRQAASTGSNCA